MFRFVFSDLVCLATVDTPYDRNSAVKQIGRATEGGSTDKLGWRRRAEEAQRDGDDEAALCNISRMVFGVRQGAEPSITPSV